MLLPPQLQEPSPIEWVPDQYRAANIYVAGFQIGWMVNRPAYCDRGHYQVNIDLPDIDGQDGFPRYYMKRSVAVAETEAFIKWRLWRQGWDPET